MRIAPIDPRRVTLLDGGLASELQRRGYDLDDPLWSGRVVIDSPEAITAVHQDYLRAGAEVLTTASYQLSVPGLTHRGLDPRAAQGVIASTVRLARAAIERAAAGRRVLVAGSLGPYGAALADGSEYRGDYPHDPIGWRAFHRPRLEALLSPREFGVDADPVELIASETLPSVREAAVLAELLTELAAPAGVAGWLSFTARDQAHTAAGEPIEAVGALAEQHDAIAAVGVNCVAPQDVLPLLLRLRSSTRKPLVAYPNRGERWDRAQRAWSDDAPTPPWQELVPEWVAAGGRLIGGCCRVGPRDLQQIAAVRPDPPLADTPRPQIPRV